MKTIVVVGFAALCAAIGETFLSYGMKQIGPVNEVDPSHWGVLLFSVLKNPYLLLGVFFLAIFFFLYLAALSWADLSFVLPITAFSYFFAAFLAKFFLKEDVTTLRWAGTIVIMLGIALVALDNKPQRTAREKGADSVMEQSSNSGQKAQGERIV